MGVDESRSAKGINYLVFIPLNTFTSADRLRLSALLTGGSSPQQYYLGSLLGSAVIPLVPCFNATPQSVSL